jgi:hypothetical protein
MSPIPADTARRDRLFHETVFQLSYLWEAISTALRAWVIVHTNVLHTRH